jgi:hypothetical protein
VLEGIGTPAPVAPTRHLVVGGLYRYIRNPMYVAVAATIIGQALLLGRPALLLYALAFGAVVWAFVRGYEEPALARSFGAEYEAYRRAVPGWWPRRPANSRSAGGRPPAACAPSLDTVSPDAEHRSDLSSGRPPAACAPSLDTVSPDAEHRSDLNSDGA